jgi:hypothetical protein
VTLVSLIIIKGRKKIWNKKDTIYYHL